MPPFIREATNNLQSIQELMLTMLDEIPVPPEEPEPEPQEPFHTLVDITFPYQLDCIVWNHRHELFAFGSYELDPGDSRFRRGRIYTAKLSTSEILNGFTITQQLIGLPGILDLKWEPSEEKRLAAATSASIILYQLEIINNGRPVLTVTHSTELPDSVLSLYVHWMNSTDFVVSDSDGQLKVWTITPAEDSTEENQRQLLELHSTKAHDFFVWFVHFDPVSEVFYSGDDDGTFVAVHKSNFENTRFHMKKKFESGVTAINTKGDIVTIGCYDDKLRIFTREIEGPQMKIKLSDQLLEMDLKGTVWRTIWIPPFPNPTPDEDDPNIYRMGVAAGKNGIHMITFDRSNWIWDTTLCCLDHIGELAYGLDIAVSEVDSSYIVSTCYFDSKVLQVFKMAR